MTNRKYMWETHSMDIVLHVRPGIYVLIFKEVLTGEIR